MSVGTVATFLEAACEVQEEELSASCMALIEERTEAVLAGDAFANSLSEETLCRVLCRAGQGSRLSPARGGMRALPAADPQSAEAPGGRLPSCRRP